MAAHQPVIRLWWWTSVPYLLAFSVIVLLLKPSPGVLAHILLPFLLAFWVTLYSSIVWLIVNTVRAAVGRRLAPANLMMFLTSLVASLIGLYVEFFWTGNLG